MSVRLGCVALLCGQTLDVPRRYFIDVINIYDQLTLSKGDYALECG